MAGIDNSAILLKSDYQFKEWSDHEHPALPCQKDKKVALMQSPSRRVMGFFIKYIYFFISPAPAFQAMPTFSPVT